MTLFQANFIFLVSELSPHFRYNATRFWTYDSEMKGKTLLITLWFETSLIPLAEKVTLRKI